MNSLADPAYLLLNLELKNPLIGIYDAPADTPFPDLISFEGKGRRCLYASFSDWMQGRTLVLNKAHHGCGGCGHWWFGLENRSRQDYIEFLADTEGLRENHDLMGQWLDASKPYSPQHDSLFVGLIYREFHQYLKSVMFFVNPDQLSILSLAVHYHAKPDDPPPMISPFGSGCMQSLLSFQDFAIPQAIIGSTDLAMRQYLPKDILIVSMTLPMYDRIAQLDERSFLGKSFLSTLKKSRQNQATQ